MRPIALATVLLLVSSASATPTGTLTKYATTWNGLPRYYAVYIPQVLQPSPALVLFLNATSSNSATNPPYRDLGPWEVLADQYGFVMAWPVSSYNPRSSQWYWDCFFMDFSFPIYPDDTGFIRSIIVNLSAQYSVNPKAVFVAGMSSGAFMAHRVGVEASDLVAAIGAASGMVDVQPMGQNSVPPPIQFPVSVLDLQGDVDKTVLYCGGKRNYWQETNLLLASLDQTAGYWLASDSCTDSVPRLCTGGKPTNGVDGLDAASCSKGVEVRFVREIGIGHQWMPGTETTMLNFFLAHLRQ